MFSKLIHSLTDIALGNHGLDTDEILAGIIYRADIKPKGRKKQFDPKEYENVVAEHMSSGGIITLNDNVTSVSVQDGKFVIHSGSPKSKGDLMYDYEQVDGGTVQNLVAFFGDEYDDPEEEDDGEDLVDDDLDNADDPDFGVPADA